MSFGWSAGDIVRVANLLWNLHNALNDADGAPEHYRGSAATLRAIQFRLRFLSKVVGEDGDNTALNETEEASLLGKADMDDLCSVVSGLKHAVGKLEALVAEGCGMKLDPAEANKQSYGRSRNWSMHQINKLRWYVSKQKEVDQRIRQIYELTSPLPDLYHKLNSESGKERAVAQWMYHETEIAWFRAIYEKLVLVEGAVVQESHRDVDQKKGGEVRLPSLLSFGSDEEFLVTAPDTSSFDKDSALTHLRDMAHEIMSPAMETRTRNLRADHQLKRKLTEWFGSGACPCLWLYGDQSDTVSAIVYATALDRRRPAIAFSGRHTEGGQQLTSENRFHKMVYSFLFQVLQQFDGISEPLVVTGVDGSFDELDLSMNSMPLALQYLGYFIHLLPECICIVDGWNFISNDAEPEVTALLRDFVGLFERPRPSADSSESWHRLLLTSPGNNILLRGLGKGMVDSFDLKNHVDTTGGMRLRMTLLGMEW
ncbi:hypothetical protein B0H63DRAFT_564625 [Podospora didyma]|uniref:Uncharacterized protein n=1 Tax=Podospora didyma TaxID=330526 RepID=A0AAE0N4Z9_9PEZI|nr:hypothetical protein B0H63DRAFT_564625 [Podospora didyma]